MININLTYFIILIFTLPVFSQGERKLIREGNEYFFKGKNDEALNLYDKAISKKKESFEAQFNRGDALYKQGKYDEARSQFEILAGKETEKEIKAKIFHNLGNSLIQQKKYEDGIKAYKNALKANPSDQETRYNLAYAQKMLLVQNEKSKNDTDNQKPSEFAKRLKEKADQLVIQRKYREAYMLMMDGLKKDVSVNFYSDFIKRLKDVGEIK